MGLPVLGICYGQQTMCAQLGGRVEASEPQEFGRAFVEVDGDCALLDGLWRSGPRHPVRVSHGARVQDLAPAREAVGPAENHPPAALGRPQPRPVVGAVMTVDGACCRRLLRMIIQNVTAPSPASRG